MSDACSIPRGPRGRATSGPLRAIAAVAVCLGLLGMAEDPAQEVDATRDAKVKAAFLYNFAKFVTWPDAAFHDDAAPFVVGVVGQDPFGKILERTFEGKTTRGRPITVSRIAALPDEAGDAERRRAEEDRLRRCHILFICRSELARSEEICDLLRQRPVLTVSDIGAFARKRGMIELVLDRDRIVPHINRKVGEEAKLRFSAKLLGLATIVQSDAADAGRSGAPEDHSPP